MRTTPALRFGRMYFRQISGDGVDFGLPYGTTYTLAFSRIVYGTEVLVAYNVSDQPRTDFIIVDASLHKAGDVMSFLFGGPGNVPVQQSPDGTAFVRLQLAPHQFVILR
jgi:alpha-amylase